MLIRGFAGAHLVLLHVLVPVEHRDALDVLGGAACTHQPDEMRVCMLDVTAPHHLALAKL